MPGWRLAPTTSIPEEIRSRPTTTRKKSIRRPDDTDWPRPMLAQRTREPPRKISPPRGDRSLCRMIEGVRGLSRTSARNRDQTWRGNLISLSDEARNHPTLFFFLLLFPLFLFSFFLLLFWKTISFVIANGKRIASPWKGVHNLVPLGIPFC